MHANKGETAFSTQGLMQAQLWEHKRTIPNNSVLPEHKCMGVTD